MYPLYCVEQESNLKKIFPFFPFVKLWISLTFWGSVKTFNSIWIKQDTYPEIKLTTDCGNPVRIKSPKPKYRLY